MYYIITVVLLLLDTGQVLGFKNGMLIDISSLTALYQTSVFQKRDTHLPSKRTESALQVIRLRLGFHDNF